MKKKWAQKSAAVRKSPAGKPVVAGGEHQGVDPVIASKSSLWMPSYRPGGELRCVEIHCHEILYRNSTEPLFGEANDRLICQPSTIVGLRKGQQKTPLFSNATSGNDTSESTTLLAPRYICESSESPGEWSGAREETGTETFTVDLTSPWTSVTLASEVGLVFA